MPRLKLYALLAPHLDGGGAGNSARAMDLAGHNVLVAWKNMWSLAMTASCGFSRMSCGFVGLSDGWQDLMQHQKMDWEFGSATNGNVAMMGEIDMECTNDLRSAREGPAGEVVAKVEGGMAVREFTLGIGIGEGHHTALQKMMGALSVPFEEQKARFILQWKRAHHPDELAAKSQDDGKLMRASHAVLLAHEDKMFSGAFVASASIPWGQVKGDDDLGGYHLVWTRDMVQTATALIACGRAETARRALVYLACTQQVDGGFRAEFLDRRKALLERASNWTRWRFRSSLPGGCGRWADWASCTCFRLWSVRWDAWCGKRRSRTRSDGRRIRGIRRRRWRR